MQMVEDVKQQVEEIVAKEANDGVCATWDNDNLKVAIGDYERTVARVFMSRKLVYVTTPGGGRFHTKTGKLSSIAKEAVMAAAREQNDAIVLRHNREQELNQTMQMLEEEFGCKFNSDWDRKSWLGNTRYPAYVFVDMTDVPLFHLCFLVDKEQADEILAALR